MFVTHVRRGRKYAILPELERTSIVKTTKKNSIVIIGGDLNAHIAEFAE